MAKKDEQVVQDDGQQSVKMSPKQIEELTVRVQLLEDQLKRAVADYQNLEKRVAEGRSELSAWTTAQVLQKILPVVDHLDKALAGAADTEFDSGWFKGVKMAVSELKHVLKGEGLDEIVADGQFDPNLHEAIDMRDGEHDKILEVVETGYRVGNKVLRPAKVVVGRKGQQSS